MPITRQNDLKKAKEVLQTLGLNLSGNYVSHLENKVEKRDSLDWNDFAEFLDKFEEDANKEEIFKTTFPFSSVARALLVFSLERNMRGISIELVRF